MKLIIGGFSQGKLAYVLENEPVTTADVIDGAICDLGEIIDIEEIKVVDHLHLLIRRFMDEQKVVPDAFIMEIVKKNPDVVFICDDIGCGIVPADEFERNWRDKTGEICRKLAAGANCVVRMMAGIPQIIKEG